jgi:hypothetical protein
MGTVVRDQIEYNGLVFEEPLHFDMLVEDWLLLELKFVWRRERFPSRTSSELII